LLAIGGGEVGKAREKCVFLLLLANRTAKGYGHFDLASSKTARGKGLRVGERIDSPPNSVQTVFFTKRVIKPCRCRLHSQELLADMMTYRGGLLPVNEYRLAFGRGR